MLDPRGRVRGKIRILCKDMLRLNIFLQLHEKTIAADEDMQRKVRLHLVELIAGEKALTKRRHSKVNERRLKWSLAEPAMPFRQFRASRSGTMLGSCVHQTQLQESL